MRAHSTATAIPTSSATNYFHSSPINKKWNINLRSPSQKAQFSVWKNCNATSNQRLPRHYSAVLIPVCAPPWLLSGLCKWNRTEPNQTSALINISVDVIPILHRDYYCFSFAGGFICSNSNCCVFAKEIPFLVQWLCHSFIACSESNQGGKYL